jgi:hypothetical protein
MVIVVGMRKTVRFSERDAHGLSLGESIDRLFNTVRGMFALTLGAAMVVFFFRLP